MSQKKKNPNSIVIKEDFIKILLHLIFTTLLIIEGIIQLYFILELEISTIILEGLSLVLLWTFWNLLLVYSVLMEASSS